MSNKTKKKSQQHFSLRQTRPLTENQQTTFESFYQGKNLMLHGVAGTGKTYISMYLALEEVLRQDSMYNNVIVVRSVVPSRDMGFLPGNQKEKAKVYEEPYRDICDSLFGRGDGYDILATKGLVSFTTTSYLRGITFSDAIVIVDECQNLNGHECDTVITRVGENSRIIFCGDYKQTDLNCKERSGFLSFNQVIKSMGCFDFIEFGVQDVVRSGLVKEYILAKERMGVQL